MSKKVIIPAARTPEQARGISPAPSTAEGNMRKRCVTALICFALLSSGEAAQQGTITAVTVSANKVRAGTSITATVSGSAGVCGAVEINWGDGDVVTYPTSYLPVKQEHVYRAGGTYTVRARGIANCGGDAATRVEIL